MACCLILVGTVSVTVLLVMGCRGPGSLTGVYGYPAIAKHPRVLTLTKNGRYTWEHKYTQVPVEAGRWWPVRGQVIVLLPDDPNKKHRFARIEEKDPDQIVFSQSLRNLIDLTSQPSFGADLEVRRAGPGQTQP